MHPRLSPFVTVLILAAPGSSAAQPAAAGGVWRHLGQPQITSLGPDREQLLVSLDDASVRELDSERRITLPSSSFAHAWLRNRILADCAGVESVLFQQRLTWSDPASAQVMSRPWLEVTGSTTGVTGVAELLEALRSQGPLLVHVETWIRTASGELGDTPSTRQIGLDEAERMSTDWMQKDQARHLPVVLVHSGQRCNLNVVSVIPYVKDYTIGKDTSPPTPVTDEIKEGLVLDLRTFVHEDGTTVTLALRYEAALLTRPVRTFTTRLEGGHTITFQVPELTKRRFEHEEVLQGPSCALLFTAVPCPVVRDVNGRLLEPQPSITGSRGGEDARLGYGIPLDEQTGHWIRADLLVRLSIRPMAPPPPTMRITLTAWDPATGTAYAEAENGEPGFERHRHVRILRDGTPVAAARVVDVHGPVVRLRIEEGTPRPGDQVQ